jgi:hypothetical protein
VFPAERWESDWLFPLIEDSHILALPLSVGMIVILNLCLLSSLSFFGGRAYAMNVGGSSI